MRSWPRVWASHRDDSIHPMLPSEGLFDNDKIVYVSRARNFTLLRDENAMRNYILFFELNKSSNN